MNYSNHKQQGVGLIEVLASLVVLSVGLLSVGTLNVKLIASSNDNKAKNEAIIIAQSRIEEMRNYSDGISTEAEFDGNFATIEKGNNTSFSGVNANFTRKETITNVNNDISSKGISVFVTWTNKSDEKQEVLVNSSIGWQKPRSSGDTALDDFQSIIKSATGKAKLGEGTIDTGDSSIDVTETGDGLFIYENIDNHSRLGDEEGNIVLTLTDACDLTTGECTEFVKISGRVYIDKATQGSLSTSEIFVKASDAAYCQQYYYNNSGKAVEINSSNSGSMQTSPSSDYTYYHYTCYLGGAWHGNIGLILDGGIGQKDKVCQGDPTSVDAYADPVISARRVYRGMTYKHDGSGNPYVDGSGDTIYYSIGVADALELPEENDSGHDFVISSLNVNDTTGDKCITEGVMVRPDSYYDTQGGGSVTPGKLFEGIPTDFFCLNQNSTYPDSFDSSIFAMDSSCPFDPSDPPSERHIISGTILVNSNLPIDDDVANMFVNTSDGSGNCRTASFNRNGNQYSIDYECDVYDWGTGWNGYIQLNTDYSIMSCDHYRETYSTILNDFNADDNICNTGGILTVEGSATPHNSKKLVSAETTDAGGQCQVSSDGTSYSCNSDLLATDELWTGRLTFNSSNGSKLCISEPILGSTGTAFITDGASNVAWIDLTSIEPGNLVLPLHVIANNGDCP